jgi:hypothetical protein
VLAPTNSPITRWWNNYREAERDPQHWRYYENEFRESFDPKTASFAEDLEFAFSARLFSTPGPINTDLLLNEILEEAEEYELDVLSRFFDPERNSAGVIYDLYQQLPFVKTKIYSEKSLGYIVLHERDNVLFFRDSHGLSPAILEKRFVRVPPRTLQKLFGAAGSRITYVDLANCDVSQAAIRARSARAFSIDESINSLNDHSHYCRSVRGYSSGEIDYGQRYLGFGRARVSDSRSGDLEAFHDWAKNVADVLRGRTRSARLFERFAEIAKPPRNLNPTSILVDLDDVIDNLEDSDQRKVRSIGEVSLPVDSGNFTLNINGESIITVIKYDESKRRFKLESDRLHSGFRIQQEFGSHQRAKSLLSYLNQEQPFRITLAGTTTVYGGGSFFEPRWKLNGLTSEEDVPMRSCFERISVLDGITSEKGAASVNNHLGWQPTSLFGLIDVATAQPNSGFPTLSSLVCDDQDDESADFIGYDEERKILAFIHAKFEDAVLSASSFHEICGQVKKNLDYAHRYSNRRPPNFQQWSRRWNPSSVAKDGKWRIDGRTFQRGDYVAQRLRRPGGIDTSLFWDTVRALILDPSANIESWIVLGGGFSYSRYVEELKKTTNQSPQVVQLAYLLQSTLDAVSQIGARFRIFCKP